MSLTNIRNDKCRIQKEMQILTEQGRYMLNVPGPGARAPFQNDVFIRMQKWGANLRTNSINIDSDLKGLTRNQSRDCYTYTNMAVPSQEILYNNEIAFVDQSRATNPAWMIRTLESNRWDYLPLNPQANLEKPFYNNISTRIVEKDNFCP